MDNNDYNQQNNEGANTQQYQEPQYNAPYQQGGPELESPMTLGEWLLTLILLAIPCINIIMVFVWGFGQGSSTTKKNFCRAYLILMAIGIVLSFLFSSALIAMIASLGNVY